MLKLGRYQPPKKSSRATLSPVTACIGALYITKGCYDFRFLKELCTNQLQAGMRLHIAAIFRFH